MKSFTFAIISTLLLFSGAFAQLSCPTISMTGPSEDTRLDEDMSFTIKVVGENLSKIQYEWIVVNGTIINGQGTSSITVSTKQEIEENIVAKINIIGLPENCPHSASIEIFKNHPIREAACGGLPRVLDLYQKISWQEEKWKLDGAINELNLIDDFLLLFVYDKGQKESLTKVKTHLSKIAKHLIALRKIPKKKVKFVTRNGLESVSSTTIYILPIKTDLTAFGKEEEIEFTANLSKKKPQSKRK